jgi:hypothetical protein
VVWEVRKTTTSVGGQQSAIIMDAIERMSGNNSADASGNNSTGAGAGAPGGKPKRYGGRPPDPCRAKPPWPRGWGLHALGLMILSSSPWWFGRDAGLLSPTKGEPAPCPRRAEGERAGAGALGGDEPLGLGGAAANKQLTFDEAPAVVDNKGLQGPGEQVQFAMPLLQSATPLLVLIGCVIMAGVPRWGQGGRPGAGQGHDGR